MTGTLNGTTYSFSNKNYTALNIFSCSVGKTSSGKYYIIYAVGTYIFFSDDSGKTLSYSSPGASSCDTC